MPFIGGGIGGGGGGESPTLVVDDVISVDEDTPATNIDLFDNDDAATSRQVLQFIVPAPIAGDPATTYNASANVGALIPGRCTLTITPEGLVSVDPVANASGAVPVVTVVSQVGTDVRTSTLTITIDPVNDGPSARGAAGVSTDGADVTINLPASYSDPDGDDVTLTHIAGVVPTVGVPISVDSGKGQVTLNLDGTLLVHPTLGVGVYGPVSFSYTVTDGTLSASGTVTVIVAPVPNRGLFSPVSPHNPSNAQDASRVAWGPTVLSQYAPVDAGMWPYIGPPDVNGNPTLVTVPPYGSGQGYFDLANREPWLYNRVRTAYLLYLATGIAAYRTTCLSWITTYMNAVTVVNGRGTWSIIGNTGGTPDDAKYLYAEIAWIHKELTGLDTYQSRGLALAAQAAVSFPAAYNANTAELWTERHCGFTYQNQLVAFYLSGGDPTHLTAAQTYRDLLFTMSATYGVPYHTKDKHEQDGDPTVVCSPWMLAIPCDAMTQEYRHTRDVAILDWLYDVGTWVKDHACYVADHTEEPEFADLVGLRIPAYLAGQFVQFPEGTAADVQHARDVASVVDRAIWAGTERGYDVTDAANHAALIVLRDELLAAALVDDAYWTRTTPGYVHRRYNPARKSGWLWNWYYALVYDTGSAPPIAPFLTVAGSIAGSTQQGATLTFTPPTFRGTPTPDNHWIWQLDGVDIAGTEDALTFDSVDVGATRVAGTLSNTGGDLAYTTNAITVVPAGATEITLQPSNQQGEVGDTPTFTVRATGIPQPTAQWQVNDGSGWVNVTGGTPSVTSLGGNAYEYDYVLPTIVGTENGDQFRCVLDNGVGSPATSNAATLALVIVQDAVQFSGSGAGASLVYSLTAGTGGTDFTLVAWVYLTARTPQAEIFTAEHVASRLALLAHDNVFAQNLPSIGDSNTGFAGGGWASGQEPPLNTWIRVALRGSTANPGTFQSDWKGADVADPVYSATRANGLEDSVGYVATHLNGGGVGIGSTMRFQYVQLYSTRLNDADTEAAMANIDPGAPNLAAFNVFENNGSGGVAVRDATGNGRVFTLDTPTLAVGPLAGSVP